MDQYLFNLQICLWLKLLPPWFCFWLFCMSVRNRSTEAASKHLWKNLTSAKISSLEYLLPETSTGGITLLVISPTWQKFFNSCFFPAWFLFHCPCLSLGSSSISEFFSFQSCYCPVECHDKLTCFTFYCLACTPIWLWSWCPNNQFKLL